MIQINTQAKASPSGRFGGVMVGIHEALIKVFIYMKLKQTMNALEMEK